MTATRKPGQRAGLDRTKVLSAARELLVQHGSDGVTIRALARHLHIAPNTLYSYVASRTALLDELLDDLLTGVATPSPEIANPTVGLHALMSSTYDVLTSAPDLVPLYLARQGARGPHAVRLGRVTDALLARAGVPAETVRMARLVLIVHTIGSAAFATGSRPGIPSPHSTPTRPTIPAAESRDTFRVSLSWLLAGLIIDTRSVTGF
jgi:TetR/AcrR family tetracycline transcriptional repressor